MPWRSSFPCHRMCCGPDNLQWFALSVFRIADMIGIDGHVSFLPKKKKKKKKKGHALHRSHPRLVFFSFGRKLTCISMPTISAVQKTDKVNHWRVSGPQHILRQGKLLRHGMMHDTVIQPNMGPSLPRRQSSTHAFLSWVGRKLTCPSMPTISAVRKTNKAKHRRVSGPQHILRQGKLLRNGMMHDTVIQPNMGPSLPRRQCSTHAWHQACDSTSEWEGHEQA